MKNTKVNQGEVNRLKKSFRDQSADITLTELKRRKEKIDYMENEVDVRHYEDTAQNGDRNKK